MKLGRKSDDSADSATAARQADDQLPGSSVSDDVTTTRTAEDNDERPERPGPGRWARQPDRARRQVVVVGAASRTVQGVPGGQHQRLGGGAHLLRRAVDLPRRCWSRCRCSACSATTATKTVQDTVAERRARRRAGGPGRRDPSTSPGQRPGRPARGDHRPGVRPSGRRPATSRAFMRASNAIYDVPEGRPIWKTLPIRLARHRGRRRDAARSSALIVVFTGDLARAVGRRDRPRRRGRHGLEHRQVAGAGRPGQPDLRDPLLGVARTPRHGGFRWVSPGGLFAVVLWLLASGAFAFYVANFASTTRRTARSPR